MADEMIHTGRYIMPIPKGDYRQDEPYDRLNMVYNPANGMTWMCKKHCVGVEPAVENAEYWMQMSPDVLSFIQEVADDAVSASLGGINETIQTYGEKIEENSGDIAENTEAISKIQNEVNIKVDEFDESTSTLNLVTVRFEGGD